MNNRFHASQTLIAHSNGSAIRLRDYVNAFQIVTGSAVDRMAVREPARTIANPGTNATLTTADALLSVRQPRIAHLPSAARKACAWMPRVANWNADLTLYAESGAEPAFLEKCAARVSVRAIVDVGLFVLMVPNVWNSTASNRLSAFGRRGN